MNNGEWLSTLDDTEAENERLDTIIDLIRKYDINIVTLKYFAWLNEPHETTADEDFLEHNLAFHTKRNDWCGAEYMIYRTINKEILDMEVYITPTETRLRIFPQKEAVFVNLEENQIRLIAEKKRREMGWVK